MCLIYCLKGESGKSLFDTELHNVSKSVQKVHNLHKIASSFTFGMYILISKPYIFFSKFMYTTLSHRFQ